MSKHSIYLPSSTASGRVLLIIGYTEMSGGPHFFCTLFERFDTDSEVLFNSLFSPTHNHVLEVDGFDDVLSQWGVELPDFIKTALREDWAKHQVGAEYCWQIDGQFEQVY